ncbi:MAG: hypothetical protein M1825_005236 [Sarcosagium campestre]|nr:MAG: hypothetical protein M1825_005236 [Sarcosagium campestre]
MDGLSTELLRDILDQIGADPDKSVSIDRRAYLSVESFKAPSPPVPSQAQDIANFRLVCKRFAELGVPHQFTRVTTRFSKRGFARLERIAERAEVAKHVKKFSYMVPCFYVEGRDRLEELFQDFDGELQSLDPGHFKRKASEQREIVKTKRDLLVLKKALLSFTSLQHVQILSLQDEPDRHLLDYIRENHEQASQFVQLNWTLACVHGSRTIGEALLTARSPFTRFSGPMMSPQGAIALQEKPSLNVLPLASQLTCLELHFEEGHDLTNRMRLLSNHFGSVFAAATGMMAVHIGFPSRAPLALPLESIFHNVRWERLKAFGIQAWRLDADEIIALARRHRRTLRGLRLRDVQLKDGSMWKDVLGMLHDEMEQLDWVSLRRIGYASTFDAIFGGAMELPPDYGPPGGSDSDDEDGFPAHVSVTSGDDTDAVAGNLDGDDDDHTSALSANGDIDSDDGEDDDDDDNGYYHHNHHLSDDDDDDYDDDDEFGDHGPHANELSMDPDTPSSVPWCNCGRGSYPQSADELGDNGRQVDYLQRKTWERWVVGRCPEHSST